MARQKGVAETKSRKQMLARGSPDGQSYLYPDSGCEDATLKLGKQSLCLECPFSLEEAPCYHFKKFSHTTGVGK